MRVDARKTGVLLTLLALQLSASSPAPAQPADGETFVYMISRSDPKAGPLEASMTVEWQGDGEHQMIVTLDRRRSHYRLAFAGYAEAGVDLWPRAHHQGPIIPECVPSPLCTFPLNDPIVFEIPPDDTDVAFVATLGNRPIIDVESEGWEIEELDAELFEVVNEYTAESTGVRFTGNYSVSRFTKAELVGGPNGSLAFASIPCDPNNGVGEALLEGGLPWPQPVASDEFYCLRPDRSYYLAGLAISSSPTSWKLEGDVVGSGSFYDGRLAVFSFPRLGREVRPAPYEEDVP